MSGDITLDDFGSICRICLQRTENIIAITRCNVIKMVVACTSVNVRSEDNLPQQICNNCYEKLQQAFDLKQLSENSDKKLRKLIEDAIIVNKQSLKEETEEIDDNTSQSVKSEYDENYSDGSFSPNLHDIKDENSYEKIVSEMKIEALELNYLEINSDRKKNITDCDNKSSTKTKKDKIENLECNICNKVFLNKHKLKKHFIAHSNDRPYQCTLCPKAFKEKFILNKHLKTIHTDPGRQKVCQICGRSIVKTSLERHLKTHENPPSYQCTECTKKFLDSETLEKHFRRVHKKETSFELYPFLCNACGKGLISKSELKRHMNSHSKEANFKCNKCGKAYTSHAGLRSHIKVFHLNERPFICTVCSRAFPTKIILKHHMRTHTGEKPFTCLICTKTFALKCVLQTHMKVHK